MTGKSEKSGMHGFTGAHTRTRLVGRAAEGWEWTCPNPANQSNIFESIQVGSRVSGRCPPGELYRCREISRSWKLRCWFLFRVIKADFPKISLNIFDSFLKHRMVGSAAPARPNPNPSLADHDVSLRPFPEERTRRLLLRTRENPAAERRAARFEISNCGVRWGGDPFAVERHPEPDHRSRPCLGNFANTTSIRIHSKCRLNEVFRPVTTQTKLEP